MPNCFQLIHKGEQEATKLQTIDAELCEHFKVRCDELQWYKGWYNTIGFGLAMGRSFERQREDAKKEIAQSATDGTDDDCIRYHTEQLAIIDYLDEHFSSNVWAEIGRGK